MGGLTTPKGGATRTQTQTTTAPQYVQDANANLVSTGQSILSPFLQTPSYTTAGINPDQEGAYDFARQYASLAFNPAANGGQFYEATAYSPTSYTGQGYAGQGYTASTYDPTMATAAQTSGADIQALMNPYISSVVNATTNRMRQERDASAAGIGSRAAAAGSFGGSREAIQRAQLDKNYGQQVAETTAQLMSQGYSQAQAAALANTSLRQQTAQGNQAAANTAGQFNASNRNTADQFTANANNTANQFTANANNTAGQFNAGAANTANAANANASNTSSQYWANIMNTAQQQQYARQLQAIQMLQNIGNEQRNIAQTNINTPLQYLQALAGITPKDNSGTQQTVAPNTAQSPLQSLLGIGVALGGKAISMP